MCFITKKKFREAMGEMLELILDATSAMSDILAKYEQLEQKVQEFHGGNSPPTIPDKPWMGWWDLQDITQAPTKVEGLRVAYVTLKPDTIPLLTFDRGLREDGNLFFKNIRPFSSTMLRPTSHPDNANSMRIIAKRPRILMVYAGGNEYDLNNHPWWDGEDKEVRPFIGDGGNDIFIVMKENYIIDGVNLIDNEVLFNVELGILSAHVERIVYK